VRVVAVEMYESQHLNQHTTHNTHTHNTHNTHAQHTKTQQEEGNIPYVVDNGVGAFETNPARIAQILCNWLDPANAAEFAAMGRRSKALGRPRAVYNIAHDLAGLMERAASLVVEGGGAAAGKRACCGGKQQQVPALVAA